MMISNAAAFLWTLLMAIAITVASSKTIEAPEQDIFHQNQLEYQPEESQLEYALVRYLMAKEQLNRMRPPPPPLDFEERQKKRSYWKQCAFNAVSCFGK